MKKALILIAVVAILSGCGTNEKLTCTTDNTVGNITSKTTYVIEYKGNDVKRIMTTYDYRDDHIDGVGTGTDGTTEDSDTNNGRATTNTDNNGTTEDNGITTNRSDNNDRRNNNTNDIDGVIDDTNADDDGIINGVVGEALDDVVNSITDTILDIGGIKTRHNTRFGSYTNTDGFTTKIDSDNENDYKVTYTYDLTKLSDTDITTFGIDRDFDVLRTTYTNRGMTCK